ncbi:MAG: ABC transporter ATP-binding protein [Chloroflexi bacterium]|jgi:ABC-type multidrug transport system ATPase subunit|nr:ABC transporter ATP-binding protein [Chloroflexota bacterium]
MSTAVLVKNVKKTFGNYNLPNWKNFTRTTGRPALPPRPVTVLDDVSFQVAQGEIFAILGSGGAGKSTLIRMLAALLRPDSGCIKVFGWDVVHQAAQVQRLINPLWMDASFFQNISMLENLAYSLRQSSLNGQELRRRILEILARLGVNEEQAALPMEALPRAVVQKAALARALLSRPRLLLLDEPTAGLDFYSKQDIYQTLRELRSEQDLTIVVATRQRAEAEAFSDRFAVLQGGRIAALETPQKADGGVHQGEEVSLKELYWTHRREDSLVEC